MKDAAQGTRISAFRLVVPIVLHANIAPQDIWQILYLVHIEYRIYVRVCISWVCLLCSNLGSAARLEKRFNEIVAIPVLGLRARHAHDDKSVLSAET